MPSYIRQAARDTSRPKPGNLADKNAGGHRNVLRLLLLTQSSVTYYLGLDQSRIRAKPEGDILSDKPEQSVD